MTRRLTFNGIVQGIGFRPAALRIAIDLGVKGQVKNSGGCVELIISGEKQALNSFVQRLVAMFEIKYYTDEEIDEITFSDFKIVHSNRDEGTPFITPDLATCSDCERELKNESNRRYRHPFISCVNCGPRYSIINSLPYDRENIAMAPFEMCAECEKEYTNPTNRRCHAQTIACKQCGPVTNISVDEAAEIIKNGGIAAIKDIGGYHLACSAHCPNAALKLREIKGREAKPFAVMFSSLEEIEEYCFVNEKEKKLIVSSERPIVLLNKKKDFDKSVCGESEYIGAFLPCNPIQIMLLEAVSPLIMTSANISGEPIITDDNEIKKFGVPVLSHNRKILTPLDDSIAFVCCGRERLIRRARGYVPTAIDIGVEAKEDTLCLGGDLKAVFAFHRGRYVFLSQHFGDLEDGRAFEAYKKNIERFARLHSFNAKRIVADAHPGYYSSRLFENNRTVQHHKAHIAAVIAEHRLSGRVLGFAFDGTGYGDDGAIWGSEILIFDGKKITRAEHLEYVKMPASDEISRNADLALACYLGGNELIEKAVENNINTVSSSSMGRLFDAAAALLDIKHKNGYEGECACALEACAKKSKREYRLNVTLNPTDILAQMKEAKKYATAEEIALGFHNMLARIIEKIAVKYFNEQGISQIALAGGVFNNRLLTEKAMLLLEEKGFSVYINEKVPCGDGAIALGQAYISAMEG